MNDTISTLPFKTRDMTVVCGCCCKYYEQKEIIHSRMKQLIIFFLIIVHAHNLFLHWLAEMKSEKFCIEEMCEGVRVCMCAHMYGCMYV